MVHDAMRRMTGVPGLSWIGVVLGLGWIGRVSGYSQLLLEHTFGMATTSCEDLSCRKEIIGASEIMGVGAVPHCSQKKVYWAGAVEDAPIHDGSETLFSLVFSCRRSSASDATSETMLASWEECGMKAEPCLDAGTDPSTSGATYQIAFEFETDEAKRVDYDVVVTVGLFFDYLRADEAFFTLRSEDSPSCALNETCHRGCDAGEKSFVVELEDAVGDGWNAGGINSFDHFRLDSHSGLMADVIVAMDNPPSPSAASSPTADPDADGADGAHAARIAAGRRTSYKNTMLGGYSRSVPLCLTDGEYFFSTEFHTWPGATDPGEAFFIGGRPVSESTWSFCGATGTLADFTYVSVVDGNCTAIKGWGETTPAPVVPATPTPAPGGDGGGGSDGDDDGTNLVDVDPDEEDSDGKEDDALSNLEILAIGLGTFAVAALAAAGGSYAHRQGWFDAAAAGAGAAGAAGAGGGAPNPNVDEFAP